jgi:outer membrane protein assembly factor BamE
MMGYDSAEFQRIVLLMSKFLISSLLLALLGGVTGCSSTWEDFSLVHIPDIQQGNLVTPEMVAELKPGMSKRQVRFLLGTPILIDVFHPDRWDYYYALKKRNKPVDQKRFSVFFRRDKLLHYSGDIAPAENLQRLKDEKEQVVSVPDYEDEGGIFEALLDQVGVELEEE